MSLICPTKGCGFEFSSAPLGGAILISVVFPKDFELLESILVLGPTKIKCKRCGEISEIETAVISCMLIPQKTAIIYVPPQLSKKDPSFSPANIKRQFENNKAFPIGFEFYICSGSDKFLNKIRDMVRKLATPILNDFQLMIFEDRSKIIEWIEQNGDKLDSSFFAALSMLIDGVIPCYVYAGSKKEEPITQQDITKSMKEKAFELKLYRLFHLSKNILKRNQLPKISELIEDTYNPRDIDNKFISSISKTIEAIEKNEIKKDNYIDYIELYAQEASLAALCNLINKENPRKKIWAARYFSYEFFIRRNKLPIEPVSIKFARNTIKYTDIGDQFINYLNPKEGLVKSKDDAIIIYKIVEDLGYEKLLGSILESIKIDFKNFNYNIFEEFIGKDPELIANNTLILLQNLLDKNEIEHAINLANKKQQQLLDCGKINDAIWLECRASEHLNKKQLPQFAINQLVNLQKNLAARSLWPIRDLNQKVDYLTEKANCLRYLGKQHEALNLYREIKTYFNNDYKLKNFRINERNLAIILREMGQINESISILKNILDYTDGDEKIDTLNSLGCSYFAIGNRYEATLIFSKALRELEEGPLHFRIRLMVLINLMSSACAIDDFYISKSAALEALEITQKTNDFLNESLIIGFLLCHSEVLELESSEFQRLIKDIVPSIEQLIEFSDQFSIPKNTQLNLYMILSWSLLKNNELAKLKHVLHKVLNKFKDYYHSETWKICYILSVVYAKNKEFNTAIQYAQRAYTSIIETLSLQEPKLDQFYVMDDKDILHLNTSKILTEAFIKDEIDGLTLINGIDIQNSLMLSVKRLRLNQNHFGKVKTPLIAENNTEDMLTITEDELKKLFEISSTDKEGSIGLLYTIDLGDKYQFLIIRLIDGKISYKILEWEVDLLSIISLVRKINFTLSLWNPAKNENPFDIIEGWSEFSNKLLFELKNLFSIGSHICIIPSGFMVDLPIHAALTPYLSSNYTPNLQVLIQQRNIRLNLKKGVKWRPKSVFNFTVWKYDDSNIVIESLESSIKNFENRCRVVNVKFDKSMGIEATSDKLKLAIEKFDLLRISCHGIINRESGQFFLLVANDKQLPPSDTRALESEDAKQFLFSWLDIGGIEQCAPMIFSTACASSLTTSTKGNEIIGFVRTFLGSGGICYVAPFWNVPAKEIQSFLDKTILNYITNTDKTLAEILLDETKNSLKNGVQEWIIKSITIQGDWL